MSKFSKNVSAKDLHFNLFYSYSVGGNKSSNSDDEVADIQKEKYEDRMQLLEDNLTRAFLIALGSLTPEQIRSYFNYLFSQEKLKVKKSKTIHLDLQNIDKGSEDVLEKIKNGDIKKVLLVISDSKTEITQNELLKAVRNNVEGGSRPDGWVIFDDTVILIESKVSNNKVDLNQLARHLIRQFEKHNLNDKTFRLVKKSWKEIIDLFFIKELRKNQISEILANDFKEVLMSTGQNLDLTFITKRDGYNRLKARNQFKPFLIKLDEEIKNYFPDLKRANRPLADYIWDYYGRVINGKVKQDPHYSIYFDVDGAGIFLTIKDKSKIKRKFKKIINNGDFYNIIKRNVLDTNSISAVNRTRYRLELIKYKPIYNLLNPEKQHHQKGETITLFKFCISLAGLGYKIVRAHV